MISQSWAITAILVSSIVLANLPFLTERWFWVGPVRGSKPWAVRLLELGLGCLASIGVGMLLEAQRGQRHPQGWEFYAVMGCLFLTLAFPGFVWRHLRRRR